MTGQLHLHVRDATDADGAGIARLIASVFAEYDGVLFDLAEFPELKQPATHYASKGGRLRVAERGGEIVGSFALFLNRAPYLFEIGKVYVAPDLRGSGLAARLLADAIAEARARDGREIILFSDTRFSRGHRFYEKHGFVRLPGARLLHDVSHSLEFGYRLPLRPAA